MTFSSDGPLFPIKDASAAHEVASMIIEIAGRLGELGSEILFIASHPDKYNDAGFDDFWRAVRIDRSHWEASYFFEDSEHMPQAEFPYSIGIKENSHSSDDPLGKDGWAAGPTAQSKKLRAARQLLNEIEAKNWTALLRKALGRTEADWMARGILVHLGMPFLLIGRYDGNGEADHYLATVEGLFYVASEDNIFLGTNVDVAEFEDLNQYPDIVQSVFEPSVHDTLAHRDLCELLQRTILRCRQHGVFETSFLAEPVSRFGTRKQRLGLAGGIDLEFGRWPKNGSTIAFEPVIEQFCQLRSADWIGLLAKAYGFSDIAPYFFYQLKVGDRPYIVRFHETDDYDEEGGLIDTRVTRFEFQDGCLGNGSFLGRVSAKEL